MACTYALCVTQMQHTIGGHTAGFQSQEVTEVETHEWLPGLIFPVGSWNCRLKFFGRMKEHYIFFLQEGKKNQTSPLQVIKSNRGALFSEVFFWRRTSIPLARHRGNRVLLRDRFASVFWDLIIKRLSTEHVLNVYCGGFRRYFTFWDCPEVSIQCL